MDYYDRYNTMFARVEVFTSSDFPEKYQTWVYEDRTGFPSPTAPLRTPTEGLRHLDAVPVCFK